MRIIDTVEALQALEAAVEKKGRDYVEPGDPSVRDGEPDHWFAYPAYPTKGGATEYGCLLGHWMGEIGFTPEQARDGMLPQDWLNDGTVSFTVPNVTVTPLVAAMLAGVPKMNDEGQTWGAIIDQVRANAGIGQTALDTPDPVTEQVDA